MKHAFKPFVRRLISGGTRHRTTRTANSEGAYVTDSDGQPVLFGSGGCVHTESWKKCMPSCPVPTLVVEDDQAMIVFAIDDAEFFASIK